jgi:hypothetical protein
VVSTLQKLLKYLDTCDGKMEDGSLRCAVNISMAPINPTSTPSTSFIVQRKETRVINKSMPYDFALCQSSVSGAVAEAKGFFLDVPIKFCVEVNEFFLDSPLKYSD